MFTVVSESALTRSLRQFHCHWETLIGPLQDHWQERRRDFAAAPVSRSRRSAGGRGDGPGDDSEADRDAARTARASWAGAGT